MTLKQLFFTIALALAAHSALAQESGSFNVYGNVGGAFKASEDASSFYMRDLRLEMKGNLGSSFTYRLRCQLNKSYAPLPLDNIPSAVDIFILGWKFSDKLTFQMGKIFQAWGGFEYDENPIFIYKYTDFTGATDPFTAGVAFIWTPLPKQEFQLSVNNTYTVPLYKRYGAPAGLTEMKHPLTVCVNWNGHLFNDLLSTRWAVGHMNFAEGEYCERITLGTRLNLRNFSVYTDLIGSWETADYSAIAFNELGNLERDIRYLTMVTKADWRVLPRWSLGAQVSLEGAGSKALPDYRNRWGAIGILEFFPYEDQNFRLFLTGYFDGCSYSGVALQPWRTTSVEAGFIYRFKAY